MEKLHIKSKLHTWGNDSKRNPVANMTIRIINEAKQPASCMREDTWKGLLGYEQEAGHRLALAF